MLLDHDCNIVVVLIVSFIPLNRCLVCLGDYLYFLMKGSQLTFTIHRAPAVCSKVRNVGPVPPICPTESGSGNR